MKNNEQSTSKAMKNNEQQWKKTMEINEKSMTTNEKQGAINEQTNENYEQLEQNAIPWVDCILSMFSCIPMFVFVFQGLSLIFHWFS